MVIYGGGELELDLLCKQAWTKYSECTLTVFVPGSSALAAADEVSAVVLDVGTSTTRAGWASTSLT